MDGTEIDYAKVLQDLKSKRDRLNSAIEGIEEMLGMAPSPASPENGNRPPPEQVLVDGTGRLLPRQVASDSFFQMSASAAAEKYLNIVKRPASTNEICDALIRGGYLTNSKNFYSNMYTTLSRTPEFVKVKKDWGLAEWYPGRRLEQKGEGKDD
jgi:hypothetical protein